MTPEEEHALWRKRFMVFAIFRLLGVGMVFAGIAIALGDLVRPGGSLPFGLPLVLVGALDALFVPRILKAAYRRQDEEAGRR
ncbi:hypothetical protein HMF7854_14845 [Sphingomonas ginkgonis]|uniref:Uncharacterized protein n=1 Tax=Sphingomonas ginkgonis TaxID=2315330 RepID=A0A3R9YP70_9SPHN|nr:hypothetical protein [Sphingomonas ginkgonis]RST31973.1 hypothetical protein HMF7854_14845 [Sphingomonas ginkgonis]